MKPFLKHAFLFALLFFVVDKTFYYFIYNAPSKEHDKRLELIVKGQMNKDILVLGSSRGANNIVTKQIEDETQLSTYNLSYKGSNIEFQEFILSSVLKFNNPPKILLLVIDDVSEFEEDKTLKFRNDRLFPLKKYKYFNDELIKRGEKNQLSRLFCLARIDLNDFKLSPLKIGVNDTLTAHGSILETTKSKQRVIFINEPKKFNKLEERPEKIEALKNIKTLCEINNIELIFVFPPNFQKLNTRFLSRFSEFVEAEKVLVYDTLNKKYKNDIYFKDVSHLLKNGAELFTTEIIDFIKKNN